MDNWGKGSVDVRKNNMKPETENLPSQYQLQQGAGERNCWAWLQEWFLVSVTTGEGLRPDMTAMSSSAGREPPFIPTAAGDGWSWAELGALPSWPHATLLHFDLSGEVRIQHVCYSEISVFLLTFEDVIICEYWHLCNIIKHIFAV